MYQRGFVAHYATGGQFKLSTILCVAVIKSALSKTLSCILPIDACTTGVAADLCVGATSTPVRNIKQRTEKDSSCLCEAEVGKFHEWQGNPDTDKYMWSTFFTWVRFTIIAFWYPGAPQCKQRPGIAFPWAMHDWTVSITSTRSHRRPYIALNIRAA